ncbi:MAG: ThiF family adenylyltransferase [Candidatus Obscuribacterales bacterium]|nr:ThiF family adenylyltransferase [Candidatus Obscuribacterales bacterium]
MKFFSSLPLDIAQLQSEMNNSGAGAFASFEGRVRDHNEGKKVLRLEYEAAEPLAIKELSAIFSEAKKRYGVIEIQAKHRIGSLAIGEPAVWVGVLAAHRKESFLACRYLIDQIKHRVPIWKKEHYVDGSSSWVNCTACTSTEPELNETQFYSRQVALPAIGETGQEKLRNARVLVVGAGGLGSSAILNLAGAGVGRIGICDSDLVEVSNLHRQIIFTADSIGQPKAQTAAERAAQLNPFISAVAHNLRITTSNIHSLLADYDLVLDCSDNLETKLLLADAVHLFRKTLVQASIYQYEGQLLAYDRDRGGQCLRCLWGDSLLEKQIKSCAEAGVLGATAGVLGSMQAMETIKIICGLAGTLFDRQVLFDLSSYETRCLKVTKRLNCSLCGKNPSIKELASDSADLEINLSTLSPALRSTICLVDIRESHELEHHPLPESMNAMHSPGGRDLVLDSQTKYVFVCQGGVRSKSVVESLRRSGYREVYSAAGGVEGLARQGRHECFSR